MDGGRVGVGLVGCGFISEVYLENAGASDAVEVVACADAAPERARARADQFGIARACTVEELLADPAVEVVLNLTPPDGHAPIGMAAVAAGKAVYTEKPLAVARADGRRLLDAARDRGVRVGAAPDTFLGDGLQTCRGLLDGGAIGAPVAATAFMLGHGPERWHPDPAFFYQPGGGPLFDMGPYYLTALISLLGPVRRVTGAARASFPERTIGSGPLAGQTVPVAVNTHVAGLLEFAGGPIATLVTSFDVWASQVPKLEISGGTGSLSLPDPNTFGGPVRLRGAGEKEWREVPVAPPAVDNSRGLGLFDLAAAMRADRPHRASGELAYHVLDVMHAIEEAVQSGRHVEVESTCERPAPLAPPHGPDGNALAG